MPLENKAKQEVANGSEGFAIQTCLHTITFLLQSGGLIELKLLHNEAEKKFHLSFKRT